MKKEKDYLAEMELIKRICEIILDFMSNKSDEHKVRARLLKESFANYPMKNDRRMLAGFREGLRDIIHYTDDLTNQEYFTLNKLLKEQTNKSLHELNSKQSKKIASIISRGLIKDDEEYALIENKVSNLSQEKDKDKEIEILNKLLIDYSMK